MNKARDNIFNNQDAILAETQATVSVATMNIAKAVNDLPPEVKLEVLAVIAQLAACSEAIGELREATVDINNAHTRNKKVNFLAYMDEAEQTKLRLQAQADGHHGSLSDYVAKKMS